MNKHEKIFFALWAVIVFPLLIIYLVMCRGLESSLVSVLLTFMTSISGVYLGARAFNQWNETPNEPTKTELDDGGH